MRAEAIRPSGAASATVALLLREILTVARYSVIQNQRNRGWLLNTSLTPFFLMAPLVFIAQSFLVSSDSTRRAFVALTG